MTKDTWEGFSIWQKLLKVKNQAYQFNDGQDTFFWFELQMGKLRPSLRA